jgi:hypothetical protein
MEKKLANKLIKKYPDLFEVDEKNPTPYSQRGIECNKGWYGLLDNALSLIDIHVKNPDWKEERWFKLKNWYNRIFWNNIFYPIGRFLFTRNIPVMCSAEEAIKYKPRWNRYHKFQKFFCAQPKYVKPKTNPVVRIAQIKEKFGGLRVYIDGNDDYIRGVISLAEKLSYSICEDCGTNHNVTQNKKGWIRSLCPSCRKIHDNSRKI